MSQKRFIIFVLSILVLSCAILFSGCGGGGGGSKARANPAIPTTPTGFLVVATSPTVISLAWTASTDDVGVTGYNIYRNGSLLTTTTGTSFADTGLFEITQYCYSVSAIDGDFNESPQCTQVCDTTGSTADTTAPGVPADFAATVVSDSEMSLTWTASTDDVGVTGYIIYRDGAFFAVSTTNSYSATGLSASTNYCFTISARDASGNISAETTQICTLTYSRCLTFGTNDSGQLGNYYYDGIVFPPPIPDTYSKVPVPAWGVNDIITVAAGGEHSLVLQSDGMLESWGHNWWGQLGNGSSYVSKTYTPTSVISMSNMTDVVGGNHFTLALKSDGTVWSWGKNSLGQLGDGTLTDRSQGAQVSGLTGITAIAAGSFHGIALKSDGTVFTWGSNFAGQLGDGTYVDSTLPILVPGLTNVIDIAGGYGHTLVLKGDGTVWSWGLNSSGQLGDSTYVDSTIPVRALNVTNISSVACGGKHSVVLTNSGQVLSWGRNVNGQLGDGTNSTKSIAAQASGMTNITAIAGGSEHTVALKGDGTVFAWGDNLFGQLGDGTLTDRNLPVQVIDPTDNSSLLNNISDIDAGSFHTIVLQ